MQTRSAADLRVASSYSGLQSAVRHAAENLGGEAVEYPNPSPEEPGLKSQKRSNYSGWFAGYSAIAQNPTLDTVFYIFRVADSVDLSVHSYHPVILAGAITQELANPAPPREVEQRDTAATLMSSKSKLEFMALTLLEPGIANVYLYADNPFVLHADLLPEIAFPLFVDAGLLWFLISERGLPTKPGTYILGTVALSLRIVGFAGFSADIDRYNTLVRSGYDLSLDALRDYQARITYKFPLP